MALGIAVRAAIHRTGLRQPRRRPNLYAFRAVAAAAWSVACLRALFLDIRGRDRQFARSRYSLPRDVP